VRGFGSFLLGLLALFVLGAVGVGIYDAGLQQGIAQSANVPAGAVPYYAYGYGFHGFGFGGLFGLIIPILFLFLIFGLIRAAFGHRRGWGHHGWYGSGYGSGKPGSGPWMGDRDSQIAEWHRHLHEAEGTSPASGSTGSGSGGSGTTSPGGAAGPGG